jgi:uncharacterized membrane-anchored protein
MLGSDRDVVSKVPAVTLGFWAIKVLATTLGETGGDTLSMSLKLGYLVSSAIFLVILIMFIAGQTAAKRFIPYLYWATIVASTMAGTTMADFATRSLGIGYLGGSLVLALCVLTSLAAWRLAMGRLDADNISSPKVELFYWLTITFSQTLGTALGDWSADTAGLGYLGAALIFVGLLIGVGALYFWTGFNRVALFWSAFILTRPLGAAVGDFLDKPHDHGGLALSRPIATTILAATIIVLIGLLPQNSGRHSANAPR